MEQFVIIVNGWKPLTIFTNGSILYVAAVLDPTLVTGDYEWLEVTKSQITSDWNPFRLNEIFF